MACYNGDNIIRTAARIIGRRCFPFFRGLIPRKIRDFTEREGSYGCVQQCKIRFPPDAGARPVVPAAAEVGAYLEYEIEGVVKDTTAARNGLPSFWM